MAIQNPVTICGVDEDGESEGLLAKDGVLLSLAGTPTTMLDGASADTPSASESLSGIPTTFQLTSNAAHTGTTTVNIEVSNDDANWLVMASLSVTGASDTDGATTDAPWSYVRANPTYGTGGTFTVIMGA